MRRSLIILFSTVGAAVIFLAWFVVERSQTEETVDRLQIDEIEREVESLSPHDNPETHSLVTVAPRSSTPLVEPLSTTTQDQTLFPEALSVQESASPDRYMVGSFDAPEQIQVAVFSAVNELQPNYAAYIDDMDCEAGDCEIVLRLVGGPGSSTAIAVSDIMTRINARFEENPLTENIEIGVRSVKIDENRDARAVLLTMLRPSDVTDAGTPE